MNMKRITESFGFGDCSDNIKECNSGHINRTYIVDTDEGKYVVQHINKNVFKKPDEVMENIIAVTGYIAKLLEKAGEDPRRGTLDFKKAGDKYYVVDDEGEYWRAYRFVDGCCYEACDSPALMKRVGSAFGKFQSQLSDFDASVLHETIPDFHNTKKRYENFEKAYARNKAGRAESVAKEVAFVRERSSKCGLVVEGIENGVFPLRVTHNDTKLNNIIMDKVTGEGLCVIDLDTVMPGSMLYDFGDSIRFGASTAAEDETDLSRVHVDTEMFRAFAEGFVDGLNGNVTEAELRGFPDGAKIITFETGMRFLTDYLDGDCYFRIDYHDHNLDRARNQFALVADMEAKTEELNEIIKNIRV